MATVADLQAKVSARLKDKSNTAVDAATVLDQINEAVNYYKKTDFAFNQTSVPITLTANSDLLPVTGVIALDGQYGVKLSYQSGYIDLRSQNPFLVDGNQYGQIGVPRYVYYRAGAWRVYFTPDQNYNATLYGLKDYPALANPTDTNDFTTNAAALIMYEACARLIQDLREDDPMGTYFAQRAQDEENTLLEFANKLTGTNTNFPDFRSYYYPETDYYLVGA